MKSYIARRGGVGFDLLRTFQLAGTIRSYGRFLADDWAQCRVVLALACASCATSDGPMPARSHIQHEAVGEFVGPPGRIRIDLGRLTIAVGDMIHPLTDCSNANFHCFRSDAIGFHIVFVRSCSHRPMIEGETVGGALFYQFAMSEHGDSRDGRYGSELSDRFAYRYWLDHGLIEIQYDRSGAATFNPRQAYQDRQGYQPWGPYTYYLVDGRSFLRCRGS